MSLLEATVAVVKASGISDNDLIELWDEIEEDYAEQQWLRLNEVDRSDAQAYARAVL